MSPRYIRGTTGAPIPFNWDNLVRSFPLSTQLFQPHQQSYRTGLNSAYAYRRGHTMDPSSSP